MTGICSLDWSGIDNIVGPCLRPGGPPLTRKALRQCNLATNSRVIDIGCGIGGTLKILEKANFYHVVGIDSSAVLLDRARHELKQIQFIRGKAEELPLKKHIFDALLCECVLSILNDKLSALKEFARILKTNGLLIMSDVFLRDNRGKQGEVKDAMPAGLYRKEEIIELLSAIGFSLVCWEEYKRALKEFAARMVLAGKCLPAPWGLSQTAMKKPRIPISYFLLVARKDGLTIVN